jgi:hypothetical protein
MLHALWLGEITIRQPHATGQWISLEIDLAQTRNLPKRFLDP